jgi:hypothetical protein
MGHYRHRQRTTTNLLLAFPGKKLGLACHLGEHLLRISQHQVGDDEPTSRIGAALHRTPPQLVSMPVKYPAYIRFSIKFGPGSLAAPMPECPRTTAGCGTLLVPICRFAPRCCDRAGGFASKLGRREAGGAIIGSVAESCEKTEFCIRAARLHPGGMWIHCGKARVLHVGTRQRTTRRYFIRRCRMEGTAKAILTGLTGTQDGLGSERRYTRTLAVLDPASYCLREPYSRGDRFLPVSQ